MKVLTCCAYRTRCLPDWDLLCFQGSVIFNALFVGHTLVIFPQCEQHGCLYLSDIRFIHQLVVINSHTHTHSEDTHTCEMYLIGDLSNICSHTAVSGRHSVL